MAFSKDTLVISPLRGFMSLEVAYQANSKLNVLTYAYAGNGFKYKRAEIVYHGKRYLHCYKINESHIWMTEGQELLTIENGYQTNMVIQPDQFLKGVLIEGEDDMFSDNKLMKYIQEEDSIEHDCFGLEVEDNDNFVVVTGFDENSYSGVVVRS